MGRKVRRRRAACNAEPNDRVRILKMVEASEQQRAIKMLDASPVHMDFSENRLNWPMPRPSPSEPSRKCISGTGWLSTSIVHDLRNPLGTVFAGAEMLMQLDPGSAQGKRLAANIYRAAGRLRALL